MWIFTKYGFYSAMCARQGDGKHGQSVDPHWEDRGRAGWETQIMRTT